MSPRTKNYSRRSLLPHALLGLLLSAGPAFAEEEHRAYPATSCAGFRDGLRVSFLDIGQGDSTLLTCPGGGEQLLIDAGESSERYPEAEELFSRSFLARMGDDRKLEYAVVTHPHQDHLFNLLELKELGVTIGTLIDNGADNPDSSLEEELRKQAAALGAAYVNAGDGVTKPIVLCKKSGSEPAQIIFDPLSNEAKRALSCPDNLNDCSLKLKLQYGGRSVLLPADGTFAWERTRLGGKPGPAALRSDVLKAGHHGSASTGKEFLEHVRPAIVILSTGTPGKGTTATFAFPEHTLLRRLRDHFRSDGSPTTAISGCIRANGGCRWAEVTLPRRIWSTAVDGTVDLYLTKQSICIEAERAEQALVVHYPGSAGSDSDSQRVIR